MYSIKEIFYTLQGEGAQTGKVSLFCRFSGCNLWSGKEHQRAQAICQFCDTDFVGTNGVNGGKYTLDALATVLNELWHTHAGSLQSKHKHIVITGGEPLLQLDTALIDALHAQGFSLSLETNGTHLLPSSNQAIDWVTVSPKKGAPCILHQGNELKVVLQQNWQADDWAFFESLNFECFYVQAKDERNPSTHQANINQAVAFCQMRPKWRLSLQTHKILGIQ